MPAACDADFFSIAFCCVDTSKTVLIRWPEVVFSEVS